MFMFHVDGTKTFLCADMPFRNYSLITQCIFVFLRYMGETGLAVI